MVAVVCHDSQMSRVVLFKKGGEKVGRREIVVGQSAADCSRRFEGEPQEGNIELGVEDSRRVEVRSKSRVRLSGLGFGNDADFR